MLEGRGTRRHKLDRKIVAEEHWLRYGVTARRKRNMRPDRRTCGLRAEAARDAAATGEVAMLDADGRSLGRAGDRSRAHRQEPMASASIVRDFSLRILRGDRIGIVGANGAGKTTLINLLTGELAARFRHGAARRQARRWPRSTSAAPRSSPKATLADALTGGGSDYRRDRRRSRGTSSAICAISCSRPSRRERRSGNCPGGERGRLMLARALAKPSNLLVLDEPTNDLDLETLDLLQEMLGDYAGTMMLVSHDRDFLDRVATSVIVAEGDGRWIEYAGGYSDMVAQRGSPLLAPAPEQPVKKSVSREPQRAYAKQHTAPVFQRKARARKTAGANQGPACAKIETAGLARRPASYAKDPNGFAEASAAFTKTEIDLAKAEERWLELEIFNGRKSEVNPLPSAASIRCLTMIEGRVPKRPSLSLRRPVPLGRPASATTPARFRDRERSP